jgi:acetylornithine deacetylase/succinyl-diaminopimelate desuccinylase-like protein
MVQAAADEARRLEPRTLDDQVRFCETAAPPFKEAARGGLLRRAFEAAGLTEVRTDRVGNVLGTRPGAAGGPHVVLAAHLDTVFPDEAPVKVTRDGPILRAPGIGDNCRGLAVIVAVARALQATDARTDGPITFVANVGEEGLGDLRGVRALFDETLKDRIDRFVSVDGSGLHVTTIGVGSRRYRVTFTGPGGHSFAAFGMASPIGALGRAVAHINELRVPATPRTTFNVGRIGGGTSVNAIAAEAWMEVDLRSADPAALRSLDQSFHAAVDAAVAEENRRWGGATTIRAAKELVGNRPAGTTPVVSPIVEAAQAAARVLGLALPTSQGSTDANYPMSLGIPAVTIGGGGQGRDAHATTESFDTRESWKGSQHATLLILALSRRGD